MSLSIVWLSEMIIVIKLRELWGLEGRWGFILIEEHWKTLHERMLQSSGKKKTE